MRGSGRSAADHKHQSLRGQGGQPYPQPLLAQRGTRHTATERREESGI